MDLAVALAQSLVAFSSGNTALAHFSFLSLFSLYTAGGETLAPQGLPMHRFGGNKITEAFNQTAVTNQNYGAIEENSEEKQRDDAYDRYVTGQ
ncbi:hypothetical protein niasHS_005909 [Heterodera schachtii]|uniref:Uncharacterized protein n=1 Tax=Heterodera schachtii TaxID=97005 RepID=A0ABD2JRY3_HETSC